MQYRKVTADEIAQAAQQVQAYTEWAQYIAFAHKVYGPNVHRIEIETYGEYDDEGGTDYRIDSVRAYDAQDNAIGYDFSTAFWQEAAQGKYYEYDYNTRTGSYKSIGGTLTKEQADEVLADGYYTQSENHVDAPRWSLPVHKNTPEQFVADQPPKLDIGDLYVQVQ